MERVTVAVRVRDEGRKSRVAARVMGSQGETVAACEDREASPPASTRARRPGPRSWAGGPVPRDEYQAQGQTRNSSRGTGSEVQRCD